MTFAGRSVDILPTDGINNGLAPVAIGERQTPDCKNVRFRESDVEKRDGSSLFVSSAIAAAAVSGIFELSKDDSTLDVVAFAGTSAVRKDGSAWSSIKGAVTITAGHDWRAAVLNNTLVLTNNQDAIYKYTGGATNLAALGGSPPSAALDVAEYHNYIVLLNTLESGTRRRARCRWSDLNNPESWPAANFNDIINSGGQSGVGFGAIGDQLYAFLSGSIWQISYTGDDTAPFTFVRAHPSIGAISRHAIVGVDGRIFFAGNRGVYAFDGGTPQYIGQPVEGTWGTINKSRLSNVVAVVNEARNEVRFSISTLTNIVNDVTLVYDYVRNTWTLDDGYKPTYWAVLPVTLPLQPVFGDANGRVLQINSGLYLDDATAITAYVRTRPTDFGDMARRRKVRRILAVVDLSSVGGANIQFRSAYDLAEPADLDAQSLVQGQTAYDTAIWDTSAFASEGQGIIEHHQGRSGRLFQAELRNDQASVGMKVSKLVAMVKGDADE